MRNITRLTREEAAEATAEAYVAVVGSLYRLPEHVSKILGRQVNVFLQDRNNDGIKELYVEPIISN